MYYVKIHERGKTRITAICDKDILGKLNGTIAIVTKNIEDFRFNEGAQNTYDFIWHEFADKIIEEKKNNLNGDDTPAKKSAERLLQHILKNSLVMLHPFIPFVTEEIWSHLKKKEMLMVERWPVE